MPEPAAVFDVGVPSTAASTARTLPFETRSTAGCLLGRALAHYARSDSVVLGLPRGGMAVAGGVAGELGLPIDVWCARELRAPSSPAVLIGAVTEGPALGIDRTAAESTGLAAPEILELANALLPHLAADGRQYRDGRRAIDLRGKTAILIDDALASAMTMHAAAIGVRRRGARQVIIASPLGSQAVVEQLASDADEVICLATPSRLRRASSWYLSGRRPSEREVLARLDWR